MEDIEVKKQYDSLRELENRAKDIYDATKAERENFATNNREILQKIASEEYERERAKKLEIKRIKKIVNQKIYDYIEAGMWIKTKTRSGNIWQKVVEKRKSSYGDYYSIKCIRPHKNSGVLTYDKVLKRYSIGLFQEHQIERSDAYEVNSILSVLVPDNHGFYIEKSFRKDIVK